MLALAVPLDWVGLLSETATLLMPQVILVLFGCLALVLSVVLPRAERRRAAWAALLGAALAAGSNIQIWLSLGASLPRSGFGGVVAVDEFALVLNGIFLLALALSIALSVRFLDEEGEQRGEYYALMVFATTGMTFISVGRDLLTLYVSLELMALSVYVLVGYLKRNKASNEASLKYFLLGAFSSGVLLYGISLIYGVTGSTRLADISARLPELLGASGRPGFQTLLVVGTILIAAGLCFKIAAVPFHMWAPDAYHGAPTPITAFMSVGVKAASFTLMVRLFLDGLPGMRDLGAGFAPGWEPLLALAAALSMTWGNVAAITQRNTKRLLAYSSIAQAGYLLLGVVAGNRTGYTGLVIYLGVYTAMNIGVFAVIVAMRRAAIEGDRIDDLNGLIKRAPGLAVLMTIFLLSLAGIPPTAGFVGKFYLFYALVETQDPWMLRLALLALLNTAVSAYYYMQIVKAMFVSEPDPAVPVCATSKPLWTAIAVAALVTIGVGVWPQPAVALSRGAVTRLATSERQPKVVRPTRRPPRR